SRILANHAPTPRTSAALSTLRTNKVNSTREPRQLRRGPLPLSHTRQNVASKIRFRAKRPRRASPSTQSMMCAATGLNCARREPLTAPIRRPQSPRCGGLSASLRTRDVADRERASRGGWRADAQRRQPFAPSLRHDFGIRGMRRSARISRGLGCWIDHLLDFSDLGRRKATDLGVLADDGLVLGEIDAKGLVVGHVALDPLNVRTELTQDLVRFCRRPSQLFAFQRADLRNIPFDDELAQRHRSPPLLGNALPSYGRLEPC